MATITLYKDKINTMESLITDFKGSIGSLKSELDTFKTKCSSVNKNICDLDEVINSVSSTTQTQEDKATSLDTLNSSIETFIEEVEQIDENVADVINESKDDFYDEYYYLKPDSEKSGWEKFCDGCKSFANWCKDNWEYIAGVLVTVIAVAAIVFLAIAAFPAGIGLAIVGAVALIGAGVGLVSQLVSDLISWAVTGEWSGTWQSYLGAMLGGAAGSCMLLICGGNPVLACAVDSAISTMFSESLEAITGGEKRSFGEILVDTTLSAGISALFCKGFDKMTGKVSKKLAAKFPSLKRLSGSGSYASSFKGQITKLKRGSARRFSYKTIRNGVVDGLTGSVISTIVSGVGVNGAISDGIKLIFTQMAQKPSGFAVEMPKIEPVPELDFLPMNLQFN